VNQFPSLLSVPCCLSAVRHQHTGPVPDVVRPSPRWSTTRTVTSNPSFRYVCTEIPGAYDTAKILNKVYVCGLYLPDVLDVEVALILWHWHDVLSSSLTLNNRQ